MDGEPEEFGGGFKAEFVFDIGAVDIDGFGAEAEFLANFFGAPPLAEQAEDFQLAIGEAVFRGAGGGAALPGGGVHDAGGHALANKDLAAEDGADGSDELVRAFLFHEVAPAAGAQDAIRHLGHFQVRRDRNRDPLQLADRIELLKEVT